jgi:anthranilate phosphoribosyltransferase
MDIHAVLKDLVSGQSMSADLAESVFEALLTGSFDEAQIGALLGLIQGRGVSVDELVGAARVMRRHVTPVPTEPDSAASPLIDTCGTGGAPKTFNISTAAAIVAAAASPHHTGGAVRVRVAKHGNRSRSGRGSAEILAQLGVNVDASPRAQARCLDETGVCFCFAIHHHPAMRHAVGPRRSLGFPTIFNLLGPLTNPASAPRQLIGVYDQHLAKQLAHALTRLETTRAMVVHGDDGMDELTTTSATTIYHVRDGQVTTERLMPESVGLEPCSLDDLTARDLDDAADVIRRVLAGEHGPRRGIVLLNAAAALVIAGAADDMAGGIKLAGEAVDSGRAARTLDELARVSHESH